VVTADIPAFLKKKTFFPALFQIVHFKGGFSLQHYPVDVRNKYLLNFRIMKNDLRAFLLPKTFPNPKEMSCSVYWGRTFCSVLK